MPQPQVSGSVLASIFQNKKCFFFFWPGFELMTGCKFWLGLFLLGAGFNIVAGAESWPAVFAGSLNDPDSYMRLERIFQGVQAGHLTDFVARDGPGPGVMVEWSRLLDGLIWLLAAPLAVVLGWKPALFAAGVAVGPLGAGALGAALAFAAEPFAPRRFLWFAVLAGALFPGIAVFAVPGTVHYHVLLLALIALTGGFSARAWEGEVGPAFLAGACGGFAIWLTPETMPFVLMIFAAFLGRGLMLPIGAAVAACAAGFVDVIGFGFAIDPPAGGYGVLEADRLSVIYVVLGLFLLIGALGLWRLEQAALCRRWRWWGAAGMAALMVAWVALFPAVAEGPYGLMTQAQMKGFFGVMTELQPLRLDQFPEFLLPGALALAFAIWRCACGKGFSGRWLWGWVALCIAVSLVLARKFILFVEFPALAAAVLLPVMLSTVSYVWHDRPRLAAAARLAVLAAMLALPVMAPALALRGQSGGQPAGPTCSLRHIGPVLAPFADQIVLASAEDAPELLYRSQVHVIGSLYQHGLPGYFDLRRIWRADPAAARGMLTAAGIKLVLVCPGRPRNPTVADLPLGTFWDAVNGNAPPGWLERIAAPPGSGFILYQLAPAA
jgi:hypothetical protein